MDKNTESRQWDHATGGKSGAILLRERLNLTGLIRANTIRQLADGAICHVLFASHLHILYNLFMRGVPSSRFWIALIVLVAAIGFLIYISLLADTNVHSVNVPTLQLEGQ